MSYTPLDSAVNNVATDTRETASVEKSIPRFSSLAVEQLSEPLTKHVSAEQSIDPFHVFREDLYRKLELVDESLIEFMRILHQKDSVATICDLKSAKRNLRRHIKIAESTLQDVHVTVQLVRDNREKFIHVDDKELYERSTLVRTSRDRVERAKQEMQAEAVKFRSLQSDQQKSNGKTAAKGSVVDSADSIRPHATTFLESQSRQSLLIQHQDETLDHLGLAVVRVSSIGEKIGEEIIQQNRMLIEMEDDLSNVEEELGIVVGKLAKFLKTKDTWQLGTILCLSATCLILLLLVLYT